MTVVLEQVSNSVMSAFYREIQHADIGSVFYFRVVSSLGNTGRQWLIRAVSKLKLTKLDM